MSLVVLEGLRPWLIQRLSALVIAAGLVYIGINLVCIDTVSYGSWVAWLNTPFNSLFTGLFIVAILFHTWVGMRDVILDYVHHVMVRLFVLSAIIVTLFLCGLWSLGIVLMPLAG